MMEMTEELILAELEVGRVYNYFNHYNILIIDRETANRYRAIGRASDIDGVFIKTVENPFFVKGTNIVKFPSESLQRYYYKQDSGRNFVMYQYYSKKLAEVGL